MRREDEGVRRRDEEGVQSVIIAMKGKWSKRGGDGGDMEQM
jgi:hypothetical protein